MPAFLSFIGNITQLIKDYPIISKLTKGAPLYITLGVLLSLNLHLLIKVNELKVEKPIELITINPTVFLPKDEWDVATDIFIAHVRWIDNSHGTFFYWVDIVNSNGDSVLEQQSLGFAPTISRETENEFVIKFKIKEKIKVNDKYVMVGLMKPLNENKYETIKFYSKEFTFTSSDKTQITTVVDKTE